MTVMDGAWDTGAHVLFVCKVYIYREALLGNKGRAESERIRRSYSG